MEPTRLTYDTYSGISCTLARIAKEHGYELSVRGNEPEGIELIMVPSSSELDYLTVVETLCKELKLTVVSTERDAELKDGKLTPTGTTTVRFSSGRNGYTFSMFFV